MSAGAHPKHKDALVINREREVSSITFAHVPKYRVLVVKYSGVNTSHYIVLEIECSV